MEKDKSKVGKFELKKEHFNIEKIPPEGFAFAESKTAHVLLNLEVSDDLLKEGFVREVVRRIQQLRKDYGLNKEDKVELYVVGLDKDMESLLGTYKAKIGVKKLSFDKFKTKQFVEFKVKDKNFEIGLKA